MGAKKSTQAGGREARLKPTHNDPARTNRDLDALAKQSGLPRDKIQRIYDQFMSNNPDGQMDRREFVRIYQEIRPEPDDKIDEIAQHVFRAFDADNNGTISFPEFLVFET